MNGGILPSGWVASGRVCTYSLRSRRVLFSFCLKLWEVNTQIVPKYIKWVKVKTFQHCESEKEREREIELIYCTVRNKLQCVNIKNTLDTGGCIDLLSVSFMVFNFIVLLFLVC